MMTTPRIITITTDFGMADGYAGAISGVIMGIAPTVRLVTITHDIPPQDRLHAQLTLDVAVPCFPALTIHLVVVDPGVGTARRPIAAQCGDQFFVGPDNGVLTSFLSNPHQRVVELLNPLYRREPLSATFHGRDIFAPAAAYLASGIPHASA